MGLIILIVLVVLLMGGLPRWSHSRNWGYGPSGLLGLVLVIVILLDVDRFHPSWIREEPVTTHACETQN